MNAGKSPMQLAYALGALALVTTTAAGCGDAAVETVGAGILPHQSPASFGEMYPLGDNDPDPTGNARTPFEWVLLLDSAGDEPLKIDEVCLVGEEEDGSDVAQFILETEGDLPATVSPNKSFGVRVTYEREQPNEGDDSDQIALVVQSNAKDFPTLVVPVCARVIADGEEKASLDCESPVTVPAGEKDTSLCE